MRDREEIKLQTKENSSLRKESVEGVLMREREGREDINESGLFELFRIKLLKNA